MTTYKHSPTAPPQRFYNKGATLNMQPGCYVDGNCSLRDATRKAINLAWGAGAISTQRYGELTAALETYADEDGSETYTEIGNEIEEALNDANASPDHIWVWDAGDLTYMEIYHD